jgi:hypothetical protein
MDKTNGCRRVVLGLIGWEAAEPESSSMVPYNHSVRVVCVKRGIRSAKKGIEVAERVTFCAVNEGDGGGFCVSVAELRVDGKSLRQRSLKVSSPAV